MADFINPIGSTPEELIELRQEHVTEIARRKIIIKDIDTRLGALMDLNAIRVYPYKDWEACRTTAREPSRSIDPIKLLQLGVPAAWIQQATVEGKRGDPGIRVVLKKQTKEDSTDGAD